MKITIVRVENDNGDIGYLEAQDVQNLFAEQPDKNWRVTWRTLADFIRVDVN